MFLDLPLRVPKFMMQTRKSTNSLSRWCSCWMAVWLSLHLTLVLTCPGSLLWNVPIWIIQFSLFSSVHKFTYSDRDKYFYWDTIFRGLLTKPEGRVTWSYDGDYTPTLIKLVFQEGQLVNEHGDGDQDTIYRRFPTRAEKQFICSWDGNCLTRHQTGISVSI